MYQILAELTEKIKISNDIYLLKFFSEEISSSAKAGQFVNVKVCDQYSPYLRRPFSICLIEKNHFGILFNITGSGTRLLAASNIGDKFDFIGPLGTGFGLNEEIDTAVLVAGGMGIAPFPFLTNSLNPGTEIITYIGAKSEAGIINYGVKNVNIATEDGSLGEKMNVIELLKKDFKNYKTGKKIKFFGCGPTPMLKALGIFALENNLNCEISTECAMACGFGLCQGCPIESNDGEKFLLVCKDGPVFNVKEIKI